MKGNYLTSIGMIPYALTPLDILGAVTIGICIFFYFGNYLRKRPLRDHLDELVCGVFFIWATINVFLLLDLYRINVNITLGWAQNLSEIIYYPFFVLLAIAFGCTIIATLLGKMPALNAQRDKYRDSILEGSHQRSILFQDFLRKFTHIAFFLILLIIFIAAGYFVKLWFPDLIPVYGQRFWELGSGILYLNVWQQMRH